MKFNLAVLSALCLVACVGSKDQPSGPVTGSADAGACQDSDGDGYGENCPAGGDCNDSDPSIHAGCTSCAYPQQGCGCQPNSKPISCYLEPSATEDGTVMCHEGTRYCRDGKWSGCESVVTYAKSAKTNTQAIINPDAGIEHCNDCSINCYVVRDSLNPLDAGVGTNGNNTQLSSGGGLTLSYTLPDAGMTTDAGTFNPSTCVLGTAPDHDCDGIPDMYDPYPNQKPFATANPALFLDIAPGETGTGVVKLQFYLNSADVYFLVDQTGSMAGESDNLKSNLTTGTFLTDPSIQCADYDFDGQPNNELKTQGIIGAVRCIIRDANFGVGYFREIPFSPYAATDNIPFRHLQDITSSIPAVISGVAQLNTVGNIDWPEDDMVAMYSLITGSGMYMGVNRPGVATRTGCPSGTYGYPCFRNNAIPIVVMFTDAPLHNGPDNNTQPYSTSLSITKGTTTDYTSISPTNETYSNAYDLGDITSSFTSYIGSTTSMASDFNHTAVTCGSSSAPNAPDAMFKFTLSANATVTATTAGSDFDTTLSLFRGAPATATNVASYPNTNYTAASAYDFGTIGSKYLQASGNSSSLMSDFSANDIGCGAAAGANDATFKFTLASATRVAVDTSGSSYGTAVGIYNSLPSVAPTYTALSNTNDLISSAQSAGSINGKYLGFSGDTSVATIHADYTAAQLNCGAIAPADAAPDAVYTFSLASPTHVRLSTAGSSIPTVIALTDASSSYVAPTAVANTNEAAATAYNIGALDGKVYQYTGSTSGMTADYSSSLVGCGTASTSADSVYEFTLASSKSVQIDTYGSSYDTVLGLFSNGVASGNTAVTLSNNNNETGTSAYNLGTVNGMRYVVSGGSTQYMNNDYSSSQIGCNASSYANDAVFKFSLSSATRVRVDTMNSSFNTVISLHNSSSISSSNNLICNDDYGGTYQSQYEINLSAGTYWIVVKGSSWTSRGSYVLTVQDVNTPPSQSEVTCNDDAGSGVTTSQINQTLAAGTYYVVVKGHSTAPSSGNYVLNVRDTSVSVPTTYQCDYNSGASGSSLIERDLTAGTYRVFVKGHAATDKGAYKLSLRDLTQVPTNEIACDHNSGVTGGSHVEANLAAGTYSVIVTGDAASNAGAYSVSVRDATNVSIADNSVACNNDASYSTSTSSITQSLTAGTYYALVKGYTTSDTGQYQLNIGGGSTSSGTYSPPTWSQTLAALQAKQTHVMTVLSCQDDPQHGNVYNGDCNTARTQVTALANATNALGSNSQPLVYDINGDGSGLSSTVVQGIAALAHYLQMDVSVRVVFDPDPNPGFGLQIVAVDSPGDGCQGVVGLAHIGCAPGATPQFQLEFTNPSAAPVPLNPNDPKGGYNFRAELIGDDQFIVDKVPIYIIPADVTSVPPPQPVVAPMGTYWQNVASPGCMTNQLPDWHDLTWDADVPQGTTVSFNVCAAPQTTDLASCSLIPLATITGGAACTSDSMCPNGFCSTGGNCQTITAGGCTLDTDCSKGATCQSGKCTFSGQPIYVGGVLGGENYSNDLRMQITLTGNQTANTAPTVHDWNLTYVCNNSL